MRLIYYDRKMLSLEFTDQVNREWECLQGGHDDLFSFLQCSREVSGFLSCYGFNDTSDLLKLPDGAPKLAVEHPPVQ